jgi:biotin carboxyl carrier protein
MADLSVKDHLSALVEFAKSVDLEEVVWERDGRRIAFRRRMNGSAEVAAPAPAAEVSEPARPRLEVVLSPMVGTFWRAVSQDRWWWKAAR